MTQWHDIGSAADLDRDGRLVARVEGRELGVLRYPAGGSLVGVRNRCPHHGAPLCLGRLRRRETGTPGRYALEAGEPTVLRCPWHGWEFDIGSGICRDEPSLRVAVYPARVEDGRVLVEA